LDFFSRTTGPILTTLGTNNPLGQDIQKCSNEGQRPCPRGDIYSKTVKIHSQVFKNFILQNQQANFSRTTESEELRFT
jgi:hypothetical protein